LSRAWAAASPRQAIRGGALLPLFGCRSTALCPFRAAQLGIVSGRSLFNQPDHGHECGTQKSTGASASQHQRRLAETCAPKEHGRSQLPQQPALVRALQFVLPNPNDLPAAGAEGAGDEAVAGLVRRDLLPPKRRIAPRLDEMPRATVPEASVDENRQFLFWKNKVGFARELRSSPPALLAEPK